MTAQKIFDNDVRKDLTDIIFEHRNKAYGAYELRKHYDERMNKSMLITLGIFVLLFFLALTYTSQQRHIWKLPSVGGKPTIFTSRIKLPEYKTSSTTSTTSPKVPQPTINPNQRNFKIVTVLNVPVLKIDSDRTINQQPLVAGTGTTAGSNTGLTLPTSPTSSSNGPDFTPVTTTTTTWAQHMPEFPGGTKALEKYLRNHIKYTPLAQDAHASGKIYISFVIDIDGTIANIKIIKDDMGFGCAQNAIDVIKNMPTWVPGSDNGHMVRVEMNLPISYQQF